MNKDKFFTMDTSERAEAINNMLQNNDFQEVARIIGIPASTFSKEMARDDYIFVKRENKYFKFVRTREDVMCEQKQQLFTDNFFEELVFIRNNLPMIKRLINNSDNSPPLILDKRIYHNQGKFANKNIKLNTVIYEEFIDLCGMQFPHLKLQDLIAQSLIEFIKKYQTVSTVKE